VLLLWFLGAFEVIRSYDSPRLQHGGSSESEPFAGLQDAAGEP